MIMEVCAEILANIKNDKFICEAISLTDDEFERARKRFSNNICSIELDYYYQYCPSEDTNFPLEKPTDHCEFISFSVMSEAVVHENNYFPTPSNLYKKHIVCPKINLMKAINLSVGKDDFLMEKWKNENEKWQNTVFEDTGFFSYVLLPKENNSTHSIGIAGKYSVETMCVTNSFGSLEHKSLGLKRPFFSPKNMNFHFDNIDFDRFNAIKPWK